MQMLSCSVATYCVGEACSGAAVLLVSEDLDEILQLSDRFYVMSNGELALESTPEKANIVDIGHAMAGHHEGDAYEQAS